MPGEAPPEETGEDIPGTSSADNKVDLALKMADHPHYWTIGWSVAAVAVSLLSATFAYRALGIAEQQLTLARQVREDSKEAAKRQFADIERSRKAAEKSADAAAASSEVARRQLQNSIELFHIDQRARIAVVAGSRNSDFVVDKPVTFRFELKNVGKTTALQVSGKMWVDIKTEFAPQYSDVPKPSVTDVGASTSRFLITRAITLNQVLMDAIKARSIRIFVYGKAQYKDIFNPTILRHLEWCSIYPSAAGPDSTDMEVCATHNNSE